MDRGFRGLSLAEEDFEELDEFDGFTYFANHTGAYSSTNYSLRLLLSGRMFYNGFDQYDWSTSFNDDRLFLDVLSENGYSYTCCPGNSQSPVIVVRVCMKGFDYHPLFSLVIVGKPGPGSLKQ